METRKLLEYFYNFILYRPEYPAPKKSDHIVTDQRTYVPYESIFGGESNNGYNIYLGVTDTELLVEAMGEEAQEIQTKTYLCMIRSDKRGYYIRNSFFISPVLFALAKMLKERNSATQLDLSLLNRANDDMDEFMVTFDRKLEYRELKEIFNYVVNKLNLSEYLPEFHCLIQERDILSHHVSDGHLMNLEEMIKDQTAVPRVELMAQNISKVLKMASPLEEDYTPERVKEMTSPEKNPLSMWPGHDGISLREQLVLNQAVNGREKPFSFYRMIRDQSQGIRLMTEIMSASLIERAAAMTRYSKPDDAFHEVSFKDNKEFATAYHMPEERLLNQTVLMFGKDTAFIRELEKSIGQVMTAVQPTPYFTAYDKPYMVQKFTSNRDLIRFLKDVYKGTGNGLARQLNDASHDWENARKEFRQVLDEVLAKREEIMQEYRTTFGYQELLEKGSAASMRLEELKGRIESSEASRDFKENEMQKRQSLLEEHDVSMKELEIDMGFFRRFFRFLFRNDAKVIQYESMKEEQKKIVNSIDEEKRELNLVLGEYHDLKSEFDSVTEDYKARQSQLEESARSIAQYRGKYGKAFTDEEILHRLVRENLRQDQGVWLSEEYNDLRKRLLLEALKVHRAFMTNCRSFKTDMTLFAMILEGKVQDRDLNRAYVDLLKVFSMMTPILYIATDYEPYFLSVAGPDDFKNAFIPEAVRIPLAETVGILSKSSRITAFNIGKDHWNFPETPDIIAKNLASRIVGIKDPQTLDRSLADLLNIL